MPSEAREAIKTMGPEFHMFEYETLQKGHMCRILRFDDYLATRIHGKKPCYDHEVIRPDKRCRIFMDCEKNLGPVSDSAKIIVSEPVDEEKYVKDLHAALEKVVGKTMNMPLVIGKPVGVERKDRFSVHLLWEEDVSNPWVVRKMVDMLKFENDQGVTIDASVYSETSCKTLRMPWSFKVGKGPEVCLVPKGSDYVFNPELFCKSLVTFHSEHSSKWIMPIFKSLEVVFLEPPRKKLVSEVPEEIAIAMKGLSMLEPGFYPTMLKVDESGHAEMRSPMWCTFASREHASNKAYVHIYKSGLIKTHCPDPECQKTSIIPYSVSELALGEVDINYGILDKVYKKKH